MADARRVRAERRAACIAQTAPVGAVGARRSPSPMVNAATGPEARQQQGSSQPPTEQVDGRTATLSLARLRDRHHALGQRCPSAAARLPWPPSCFVTNPLPTAMTTGSIASRSSSLPPATQWRSPTRSGSSRP
ncbi:hypothetical protein D1007_46719 [Hordeum vulgare]|nr:hypothetical protein D1007_46719 [Hordeum vulgare]